MAAAAAHSPLLRASALLRAASKLQVGSAKAVGCPSISAPSCSSSSGAAVARSQQRGFARTSLYHDVRLEYLEQEAAHNPRNPEKQAAYLKELIKVDPDAVVRRFESGAAGPVTEATLAEYVKALVKMDRLDEAALLSTVRRGATAQLQSFQSPAAAALSTPLSSPSAASLWESSATGVTGSEPLGSAKAPIHMVAVEPSWGQQLWRTIRSLGGIFLLMSFVGALVQDKGLTKGIAGLGLVQENEGIIVIAATNFPEALDKALIRPGRFDRHVVVPNPDVHGRSQILDSHMRGIPREPDVDLHVIARGTPGFSGADLANLVNVAALKAAMEGSKAVSMTCLEYAKDKIMMGTERKSAVISAESRKLTAYHEGGHALVAMHTPGADPVHKATIIPRGMALGMVAQLPDKDETSITRQQMLAKLAVCMGGRVAEELIFGDKEVTSGASSDIAQATRIARQMVTKYGMSRTLGLVEYDYDDASSHTSTQTRQVIEQEVRELVQAAYEQARKTLMANEKELHTLAQALLKQETLTGAQIKALLQLQPMPSPEVNQTSS
eukprot:jgi/Chlat1/7317/Chrsp58S06883